jgi:predicted membrane protein
MKDSSNNSNGRIIVGVILIVLGSLFFLRNFHFLMFNIDLFSWPVMIFILGIVLVAKNKNTSFGFILIAFGGLGIASRYFNMPIRSLIMDYWPFLLIIFGIYVIFKRSPHHEVQKTQTFESEEFKIDLFTLLASKNVIIKTNEFLGGRVTSILGESIIDLRNCNLAEGKIELETQTILGSTEIHIPNTWNVINKTTTILGGFEDKRATSNNFDETKKTIVLKGLVLLGGGVIKD